MRMIDIIEKKKNSIPISKEEIEFFITSYMNGIIPDYQVTALMMAIYFNSMNDDEIYYLTQAMVNSGESVDLSDIDGIKVDKHSTGGVADTTTLIVGPLVASCGVKVCKMSGRGLGHTGGTLDKLESIPNFNVSQDIDSFKAIIKKTGLAIIGQSGDLAPADKMLYALRDVSSTVDSIPLIASSIMSKKIASGADALVLDVKVGNGSFIGEYKNAKILAKKLVALGKMANIDTRAILSDMNQPLGRAVGNSLEVIEAIDVLKGSNSSNRLKTVAFELGANMIQIAGICEKEQAYIMMDEAISSRSALDKLKEMVIEQGGQVESIDNTDLLPKAKYTYKVCSITNGFVSNMDTQALGRAACILGAGREKKGDIIDLGVGYIMECELGDYLECGDEIATIYYNDKNRLDNAVKIIQNSITQMDEYKKTTKIIYEII